MSLPEEYSSEKSEFVILPIKYEKDVTYGKGASLGPDAKIVNSSIEEYYDEKFDTLLLLMNGIGLAGTLEALPKFLDKLKSLLNPGGQILLDSSDIAYMFEDEDGGMWIDLGREYYGELTFQMHYNTESKEECDWLYIDFAKLQEIANNCGLSTELLFEGEQYDYLAKLQVI